MHSRKTKRASRKNVPRKLPCGKSRPVLTYCEAKTLPKLVVAPLPTVPPQAIETYGLVAVVCHHERASCCRRKGIRQHRVTARMNDIRPARFADKLGEWPSAKHFQPAARVELSGSRSIRRNGHVMPAC